MVQGMRPFEKHLAGEASPYELLARGSWTSGDEAAQAGFDMRLFYRVLSLHPYMPCRTTPLYGHGMDGPASEGST